MIIMKVFKIGMHLMFEKLMTVLGQVKERHVQVDEKDASESLKELRKFEQEYTETLKQIDQIQKQQKADRHKITNA